MPKQSLFHLSPSAYHQQIMSALAPALRYTGGDLATWRRRLRNRLRQLLGDRPAERADLKVVKLWTRAHPLGHIEKIIFTSEPYCQVPAYVCLPNKGRPPFPFMICLQGHTSGMHHSIATW
jgi:hypothetical protein